MSDALATARRLQLDAAALGFDWSEPAGLWEKLAEEIGELREAVGPEAQADELGDVMFMLVNISRHLGLDASEALAAASAKFTRRFAHILAHAQTLPPLGDPGRLQAMEALWQDAKRIERQGGAV